MDAARSNQRPATGARLTGHVQRGSDQLTGRSVPDGVPFGVIGKTVRVVGIGRTLLRAQLPPRTRPRRGTAGHPGRGTVVTGPPHLVGSVDEDGANLRARAVSARSNPLGTGQKVRVP